MVSFSRYQLDHFAEFVRRIESGRSYSPRELGAMGADASILACFLGLDVIPARNVLCVCCLMLGLDVFSERVGGPRSGFLRVRVLNRIGDLLQEVRP